MRHPEEMPNPGWETDSAHMDDYSPMLSLIQQERYERAQAFQVLYGELDKVELLGRDDSTRASFHKTYIEDSNGTAELWVYADRTMAEGIGAYNRVWANIIRPTQAGGRELYAADFAVSRADRLITVHEDTRIRGHHDKRWPDLQELMAPFLKFSNNNLIIINSPNYAFAEPTDTSNYGRDFMQVLDRRVAAMELIEILKHLSESSREDYATW